MGILRKKLTSRCLVLSYVPRSLSWAGRLPPGVLDYVYRSIYYSCTSWVAKNKSFFALKLGFSATKQLLYCIDNVRKKEECFDLWCFFSGSYHVVASWHGHLLLWSGHLSKSPFFAGSHQCLKVLLHQSTQICHQKLKC